MTSQVVESLPATQLMIPALRASIIMDSESLHSEILSALPSDPVAMQHLGDLAKPNPRWTQTEDSFLRLDNQIYVPKENNLRLLVLQYKHDHVLSGHFGQNKTLALIFREYTWPGLRTSVVEFCKSCTTCMCSKSQRHKPYGFLKQLPIPERPWDSISMDFIEQLPPSLGFTSILIIVCRLTKQSIFIPTVDMITLAELAKLFVFHFFRSFSKALDMHLHFTSGYHPKADSQ